VLSLRVTRDRRGYDHIYLVEETRRRGRSEGRLLYWCRLPGGMRVGRDPFDEDTRRRLERANPQTGFDWPSLSKTLASALAAARWAARQQQEQRSGGRPSGPPDRRSDRSGDRGDRGGQRPTGQSRSGGGRRWREDGEGADDVEGAPSGPAGAGVAEPAE
jgi:hypothetical protein